MCGLKVEIISTASLVIMKGSFFNKKCVQKKWLQFTLNKFILKFKTLHFKSIIQCKGA